MAYATLEDVLSRAPQIKLNEASKPTIAEASNIVRDVEAEVNGILRGLGYIVPLPATSPESRKIIRDIVTQGSIAKILKAMFYGIRDPSEVGANDAWKEYRDKLRALVDDRNPFSLPDAEQGTQVTKDDLSSYYGLVLESSDETEVFRPSRNQIF